MHIQEASDPQAWDAFIAAQPWRPFLQSWTMGEVYADIGQEPVRLVAHDDRGIRALCFAHVVDAKRGKHLSVPYGPLVDESLGEESAAHVLGELLKQLKAEAAQRGCAFVRMSPFWKQDNATNLLRSVKTVPSPLHLLAEHIWYLPLTGRTEEQILADMRKTTRNLIGRAGRDGVTIVASDDPVRDLPLFITLHDETRKRHGFTPYTNDFFRAQVARFAPRKECTLYLARYQGQVIAASIHMHVGGETSYHHGASAGAYSKVPASYLLQWTAIRDAIKRGDRIYNFWGIAPQPTLTPNPSPEGRGASTPLSPFGGKGPGDRGSKDHPFAGVTLFKTGFGGEMLNLAHCVDLPVTWKYWLTNVFERVRKWRRGF